MASIFSKIIAGEIPCYRIAEDEKHLAFLDINPNAEGHTLCIPKTEVDQLFDLSKEDYAALMLFSRKVAQALKKTVPCQRIAMSVIGLEVPHAHVHLIPLNAMEDVTFGKKVQLDPMAMQGLAKRIAENLA
jgi:histidine triad (HIT) family protein